MFSGGVSGGSLKGALRVPVGSRGCHMGARWFLGEYQVVCRRVLGSSSPESIDSSLGSAFKSREHRSKS